MLGPLYFYNNYSKDFYKFLQTLNSARHCSITSLCAQNLLVTCFIEVNPILLPWHMYSVSTGGYEVYHKYSPWYLSFSFYGGTLLDGLEQKLFVDMFRSNTESVDYKVMNIAAEHL